MKKRTIITAMIAIAGVATVSFFASRIPGVPVAHADGHGAVTPRIDGDPGHALSNADYAMVRAAQGNFSIAPMYFGTPAQLVGKPVIYVFLDPNCKFCHRFYDQIMPLVKRNAVQVRAIMVGFVKPSSIYKAAAIEESRVVSGPGGGMGLEAANALASDEYGFQKATESGAMTQSHNPQALAVIKAHNALLGRLAVRHGGHLEVPTIVAVVHGQPSIFFGAPPQGAAAFVNQINNH